MRHITFLSLFIAAALAVPVEALAQPLEGNPSSGRQVAIEICSGCHQVDADMSSKGAYPPSFEDIAKLPSTTALSLQVFLRSSHITMPNLLIFAPDIDDLIVYILSLKQLQVGSTERFHARNLPLSRRWRGISRPSGPGGLWSAERYASPRDANGPVRRCWVTTDRDCGYGYWQPC